MADELDERRKIDRAARAKALATDPLLVEGFDLYERDIMAAWTDSRTPEAREQLWALMQASRKLRQHLEGIINDGKVSQAILIEMLGRDAA